MHHIITDVHGYHKVCAWWATQMMTPENNQASLATSLENLSLYIAELAKFLSDGQLKRFS